VADLSYVCSSSYMYLFHSGAHMCSPQFSAETLGKPESYICVSYTYNETLIFDGTFEPAFLFNIASLEITIDMVGPAHITL